MRKFLAPLLFAALITPALADTNGNPCLRSSLVDGYTNATDDSIVLTQGNRNWKADFAGKCTGLRFAETVGVKSRTTCVTPGDSIRFREAGGIRQICMISELTYLPKEEKAAEPTAN